uniref:DUF3668 domain-containing protein n=1 Tax=Rhabditophanes sp. KR3021 TaxID=114890 RepID=A0AC35TLL9_9BILA
MSCSVDNFLLKVKVDFEVVDVAGLQLQQGKMTLDVSQPPEPRQQKIDFGTIPSKDIDTAQPFTKTTFTPSAPEHESVVAIRRAICQRIQDGVLPFIDELTYKKISNTPLHNPSSSLYFRKMPENGNYPEWCLDAVKRSLLSNIPIPIEEAIKTPNLSNYASYHNVPLKSGIVCESEGADLLAQILTNQSYYFTNMPPSLPLGNGNVTEVVMNIDAETNAMHIKIYLRVPVGTKNKGKMIWDFVGPTSTQEKQEGLEGKCVNDAINPEIQEAQSSEEEFMIRELASIAHVFVDEMDKKYLKDDNSKGDFFPNAKRIEELEKRIETQSQTIIELRNQLTRVEKEKKELDVVGGEPETLHDNDFYINRSSKDIRDAKAQLKAKCVGESVASHNILNIEEMTGSNKAARNRSKVQLFGKEITADDILNIHELFTDYTSQIKRMRLDIVLMKERIVEMDGERTEMAKKYVANLDKLRTTRDEEKDRFDEELAASRKAHSADNIKNLKIIKLLEEEKKEMKIEVEDYTKDAKAYMIHQDNEKYKLRCQVDCYKMRLAESESFMTKANNLQNHLKSKNLELQKELDNLKIDSQLQFQTAEAINNIKVSQCRDTIELLSTNSSIKIKDLSKQLKEKEIEHQKEVGNYQRLLANSKAEMYHFLEEKVLLKEGTSNSCHKAPIEEANVDFVMSIYPVFKSIYDTEAAFNQNINLFKKMVCDSYVKHNGGTQFGNDIETEELVSEQFECLHVEGGEFFEEVNESVCTAIGVDELNGSVCTAIKTDELNDSVCTASGVHELNDPVCTAIGLDEKYSLKTAEEDNTSEVDEFLNFESLNLSCESFEVCEFEETSDVSSNDSFQSL